MTYHDGSNSTSKHLLSAYCEQVLSKALTHAASLTLTAILGGAEYYCDRLEDGPQTYPRLSAATSESVD